MNCKRAEILMALQLPKRGSQLPGDLRGDRRLVLAVIVREPVFRHSERSKQQIPEGKSAGKVSVATLLQRGVMPAVKTGLASTYLKGPRVQLRLAWTNAEWKVVKGPTQSITLGDIPAISNTTSTMMVPRNRLAGWKRAAEIQSSSSEE